MQDIQIATQLGIIKGEGCFEPFLPITYQAAANILSNISQLLGIGKDTLEQAQAILRCSDSDITGSDLNPACTIEQSISALLFMYQNAVNESY